MKYNGKIINDTTLLNMPKNVKVVYRKVVSDKFEKDTFCFHKFNNKPDSINKFIKRKSILLYCLYL